MFGFYEKLCCGIEKNIILGVVFCCYYYIDENDYKKYLFVLERDIFGVIEKFIEKIIVE